MTGLSYPGEPGGFSTQLLCFTILCELKKELCIFICDNTQNSVSKACENTSLVSRVTDEVKNY